MENTQFLPRLAENSFDSSPPYNRSQIKVMAKRGDIIEFPHVFRSGSVTSDFCLWLGSDTNKVLHFIPKYYSADGSVWKAKMTQSHIDEVHPGCQLVKINNQEEQAVKLNSELVAQSPEAIVSFALCSKVDSMSMTKGRNSEYYCNLWRYRTGFSSQVMNSIGNESKIPEIYSEPPQELTTYPKLECSGCGMKPILWFAYSCETCGDYFVCRCCKTFPPWSPFVESGHSSNHKMTPIAPPIQNCVEAMFMIIAMVIGSAIGFTVYWYLDNNFDLSGLSLKERKGAVAWVVLLILAVIGVVGYGIYNVGKFLNKCVRSGFDKKETSHFEFNHGEGLIMTEEI